MKNKNGITLIALVITIVVLIILAGVAINLTLGENGILNKTQQAKQKQSEAEAREKLELVLVDARIEKETNVSYNDDYLNDMLEAKGITVDGSSVIVDNYNFLIDREQLIILDSLGETQIKVTAEVQEYLGKNVNEKYEASLLLIVESNAGLQSVVITNPDGTTFEMETEKIKLGKDMTVELDAEYIVTVTTKDGNTTTRKIVEKSEETIGSVAELVAFRDKVNSGLTYEGKTIRLTQDLDLSSVCGENINGAQVSWEPIGTETNSFKGTFDGKNKTISNLYIKSDKFSNVGLFNKNEGVIKNIIIEKAYIDNLNSGETINTYTGIIAAINNNKIMKCGLYNSESRSSNTTAITSGWRSSYVGGIVGYNIGIIDECFNQANIDGKSYNSYSNTGIYVGGIAGSSTNEISNCYNIGKITAIGSHCYSGGIVGQNVKNIRNSYNTGLVSGQGNAWESVGGIIGENYSYNASSTNSYCINTISYYYYYYDGNMHHIPKTDGVTSSEELKKYANILGDSYTNDELKEDSKTEYKFNDGYPILKWQVEE